MSAPKLHELIASVDNGLQIAQFIQENRDAIQKTNNQFEVGGHSEPSSTSREGVERGDTPRPEDGSNLRDDGLSGAKKESGEGYYRGSGQTGANVSVPVQNHEGAVAGGNHQEWDAENYYDEDLGGWINPDWDIGTAIGGGAPDEQGDEQPYGGGKVHSEDLRSAEELDVDDGSDRELTPVPRRLDLKDPDNLDQSVLDEILTEESLSASRTMASAGKLAELAATSVNVATPIKKGTEERSLSMSSTGRRLSENGASQVVLESNQHQLKRSASAGSAQKNVSTASMTSIETMSIQSEDISLKLDSIMQTQQQILERFTMLSEVREEINGIKKVLHNFGLTLSTIESYITSLMIIIPKQGIPPDQQGKEVNPDLKLVIGRDKRRGLKDEGVLKNRKESTNFGEDIFQGAELSEDLFLPPISSKKNHAAKFIPGENSSSFRIIHEILRNRVKDPELSEKMIAFVEETRGKLPVEIIYSELLQTLDSMGL